MAETYARHDHIDTLMHFYCLLYAVTCLLPPGCGGPFPSIGWEAEERYGSAEDDDESPEPWARFFGDHLGSLALPKLGSCRVRRRRNVAAEPSASRAPQEGL